MTWSDRETLASRCLCRVTARPLHPERPCSSDLWEQTPAAVQDYIRAPEARVTALEAAVQRLAGTRQPLTERLPHDARPASRPPSSEPPQATTTRPRRDPSGRRPGGQPGHQGPRRALVPVEAVAVGGAVQPERCRRCPHPPQGEEAPPARPPGTALPPLNPVVTADQWPQWGGPACGQATRGELPVGGPSAACGPRGQAITARCTGAYHVSKRTTPSVLEELCGLPRRLGTMAPLERATLRAVKVAPELLGERFWG